MPPKRIGSIALTGNPCKLFFTIYACTRAASGSCRFPNLSPSLEMSYSKLLETARKLPNDTRLHCNYCGRPFFGYPCRLGHISRVHTPTTRHGCGNLAGYRNRRRYPCIFRFRSIRQPRRSPCRHDRRSISRHPRYLHSRCSHLWHFRLPGITCEPSRTVAGTGEFSQTLALFSHTDTRYLRERKNVDQLGSQHSQHL